MSVKIRKVGNSLVLTVPKNIKVSLNKEYDVFTGRQGAITFLPVESNSFHTQDTIKKYRKFNGDATGFVDADVDNDKL